MKLNLFDLNLLRALDTLLTCRNVTRAARQLHVTQQAMSGSLKRLREHFDDALLVRVGNHLEPTPLGAALVSPVREVMLQIALALETTPSFDPAQAQRRFRVALSDYATVTILPHFMGVLAARAPGIVCDFQLIDDAVMRDLEAGVLDFCLLPHELHHYRPSEPRNIRRLALFSDDFVCVVSRDNAAVGEAITLDEYLESPHNSVQLGGDVRSMIENGWARAGIAPNVVATTTSFASLVFMVPGTPLIATAQRRLATQLSLMLPIRVLECPVSIPLLKEEVIWHGRNDLDPAHRFIRETFVEASREMPEPHNL